MTEDDQERGTDRRSGGNRDKDKWKPKSKHPVYPVLGMMEELEDNVYKIHTNDQADVYIRTTEAIAEHAGVEYGFDLRIFVKYQKEAVFTKPKFPTPTATVTTRADWNRC
jgi:hypothetical protein